MFGLWEGSLISSNNNIVLLAIIVGIASLSIVLEQKYEIVNKMTGAVLALLIAMTLSNLKIIPIGSNIEHMVWAFIVPIAIPMLLFKANLFKIWRESGKILGIYIISSIGTLIGTIVAILAIGSILNKNETITGKIDALAAMMTGSYIGGGVNFAAMADSYNTVGTPLVSSLVVADNFLMVLYFFVLLSFTKIPIMRRIFQAPHINRMEKIGGVNEKNGQTQASKFWERKEISLKDIALVIGIAIVIVAISSICSKLINTNFSSNNIILKMIIEMIGNKYLLITTFTLLLATFKAKSMAKINGSQEIGTFLIYIFFTVIGIPASIDAIIDQAPILFVFTLIMVVCNLLVTFTATKIFNFTLEEGILASNANIGGPTTAAAIAISKGWIYLIAPIMLVGTLGYVVGNYVGLIAGNIAKLMGY